jgi:hypothetical protein
MKTKRLFARLFMLSVLACLTVAWRQAWPNLETMTDPGYPSGECTRNGNGKPNTPKALANQLKNRYQLPTDGLAKSISWDDFLALMPPPAANQTEALKKSVNLSDTGRYVVFTGYVSKAFSATGGESCNCGTHTESLCDTHIEVLRDPGAGGDESMQKVIVETTSRTRLLATKGFLTGKNMNKPSDWSTVNLQQMVHHWVRFKGWLFYDADHYYQDWQSDPNDKLLASGKPVDPSKPEHNWRATCWEVHPIMSIEILDQKPDSL